MSRGRRSGDAVRLLVHSGSPRAFSPRDDKIWSDEIGDSVHQAHCHCEERTQVSDAAIHWMQ
ncbi:hypothetical protein N9E34_06900 [Opitutales bacterium]|nr:hypothetical protein [Opitutales bacterium]